MSNVNGASPRVGQLAVKAAENPGSTSRVAGSNALGVQKQLGSSEARSSALAVPKEKLTTKLLSALGLGNKPLSDDATKGLFLQRLSAFATKNGIDVPDKLKLATEFVAETKSRNADVLLREADSFIDKAIPNLKMNDGRDDKAVGGTESALHTSAVIDQRSRDVARFDSPGGGIGSSNQPPIRRSALPAERPLGQPSQETRNTPSTLPSDAKAMAPATRGPMYNNPRIYTEIERQAPERFSQQEKKVLAQQALKLLKQIPENNDGFFKGSLPNHVIQQYVAESLKIGIHAPDE